MSDYTIRRASGDRINIEADDFSVGEGLIVFRDGIGRSVHVVAIEPGLAVSCVYDEDDDLFTARRRLASAQRAELIAQLEHEATAIEERTDAALG